ncbi:MAG: DUF3365 domain-containing protein [Ignavibacteriae bacterium]|nr:DUF3365 domain-containing protein [Ignavibacteriota bacterium]NOG97852.1 DUF3365 domain-containing protein [Ignavibacteriota bacterium]
MKFKKIILMSLVLALLFACSDNKEFNKEDYRAEFDGYAKEFMTELKSVLQKNMKEGGPVKAVTVCSDTAQMLTQNFAEVENIEIKRVSFKNRNPNNIPDEFEGDVLYEFERLAANGNLKKDTTVIKKVREDGIDKIKFMKPIMVEAPCLLCHGQQTEIMPQAAEIIKNNYPYDKATGYKVGDLRGAISITKIM